MSRSTKTYSDSESPSTSRRVSDDKPQRAEFVSDNAVANLKFQELINKFAHSEHKLIKDLGEKLQNISVEKKPQEYQEELTKLIGIQYMQAFIKERQLSGTFFKSTKKVGMLKVLDDEITTFNKKHTDSPFLQHADSVPKDKLKNTDYRLFTSIGSDKEVANVLFGIAIQALSDRSKEQFVNCLKVLVRIGYGGRSNWDTLVQQRLGTDLGKADSNLMIRDTLTDSGEKELTDYYSRVIRNQALLEGVGKYALTEFRKQAEQEAKPSTPRMTK